jgi:AcrR family transcriptional regulator
MLDISVKLANEPPPTRDRILDALIAHISEVGMRKLTMDDIAQRAELSRVTLYTYFPNKQAIVRAAVLREMERFFAELESAGSGHESPEDRLVETFAHGYRYLTQHPLVQRMIRAEPELLATYLARDTPAIPLAREWVAAKLAADGAELLGDTDPNEAAEVIVRTIHSLILVPATVFRLDRRTGPQDYARRWILPAIRGGGSVYAPTPHHLASRSQAGPASPRS